MNSTTMRPAPGWLREAVACVQHDGPGEPPLSLGYDVAHSNDICEAQFADGRALLLRVARHDWGECGFARAAHAAELLAGSGIVVPRPLPIRERTWPQPVQAYWRIPLPTLAQLWPGLSRPARVQALRSWGALLRRLHAVRVAGYGPLTHAPPTRLESALDADLRGRLRPAVYAHWPAGAWWLERLIAHGPAVAARRAGAPLLGHGDMHMGNVLCRPGSEGVACVGLLDMDEAQGAPPEYDLASVEVLHGRLFARPLARGALAQIRRGYGARLDPVLLEFYRCVQLVNQGFSSGLLGHAVHAHFVALELGRRVRHLERALGGQAAGATVARAGARALRQRARGKGGIAHACGDGVRLPTL